MLNISNKIFYDTIFFSIFRFFIFFLDFMIALSIHKNLYINMPSKIKSEINTLKTLKMDFFVTYKFFLDKNLQDINMKKKY
jgi:hypothetical protein